MKIDPLTRRALLLRGALPAASLLLGGCGGGGDGGTAADPASPPASAPAVTPDPPPPPVTTTPLQRLRAALQRVPPEVSASPVSVTQTPGAPALGPTATILPGPLGRGTNPNPINLANLSQVWGWRRDLWTRQTAGLIGTTAANTGWVTPVSRRHRAATAGSDGVCGLHFVFDGRAFEVLFAGTDAQITLIADGRYMAPRVVTQAAGVPLNKPNCYVQFDFGSRATRQVSIYGRSSQGPCALAIASGDTIQPWDRSAEPSFAAMTDSYGGVRGPNWGSSGPFWEAAALLGIPHLDIDAIGGTGYAPNNATSDTRNPGNAFGARVAGIVDGAPDLFLTCGSLNDNNSIAAPPLYASAAEALAAFDAGVVDYYQRLRAALPDSLLVATGPWAPREHVPPDPVALSKAATIRAALQAVGGPWVYLDNLQGGWANSAGAIGGAGGAWQTGTGTVAVPTGKGNGDLYVSADGTHPSEAGCQYLARRIADDLRAAIVAM